MSKVSRMALCAVLLLLVLGANSGAAPVTRPGAFLNHKAGNPQELAGMIKKSPVLSVRYAQHYGMSPAAVADYFQNNVKLVRLRSDMKTNVYFIDSKGRVLRKVKTLPAGRLVFATEDGEPLLDWECGNPLTTNLPQKKKKVEKFEAAPEEVVEMALPEPPVEVVASLASPTLTVPVVAAAPMLEAAVMPATTSVDMVPAIMTNYSGGLALLSLAAVSFTNHKSVSPVPEPSALLGLGSMGLAGSLAYVRSRRRRNS